ncbi:MAG: hypothetical protein ABIG87_00035 [Patescibacteria group bacterium]
MIKCSIFGLCFWIASSLHCVPLPAETDAKRPSLRAVSEADQSFLNNVRN